MIEFLVSIIKKMFVSIEMCKKICMRKILFFKYKLGKKLVIPFGTFKSYLHYFLDSLITRKTRKFITISNQFNHQYY